jgi:hypothetical protein
MNIYENEILKKKAMVSKDGVCRLPTFVATILTPLFI